MNALILYLSIATAVSLIVYVLKNLDITDALNLTVLILTALALVWTTVDAKNNSLETKLASLRPVILRDGVIQNWISFKHATKDTNPTTNFFVATNVVTNVTGFVVADGKRYELSFAVTRPGLTSNQVVADVSRASLVTWSLPNKLIIGQTFHDRFDTSLEPEGIYIFYSDIEGTKYKTYENSKFETVSTRVMN